MRNRVERCDGKVVLIVRTPETKKSSSLAKSSAFFNSGRYFVELAEAFSL